MTDAKPSLGQIAREGYRSCNPEESRRWADLDPQVRAAWLGVFLAVYDALMDANCPHCGKPLEPPP